ncbi:hypothetical protein [Salimicrobium halophilum]|uniref:Lipoprotein n=1 Tax=Salimicrobium halophilum TaxID=86666 RepID=A0A1G8R8Y9_9BACI|nr:hypothetical protein [Salimicrobium halophilum]SDJ12850.1 hypothetical protein SAMN04490247_0873 [Salimicrobium halophilum]
MRILYLLAGLLLLAACTSNVGTERLSTEKVGVYHGLIVYSNDADAMENPEFLRNLDEVVKDRSELQPEVTMLSKSSATEQYPDLEIPTTPYYVFYDKDGIGVETADKKKAETFLLEEAERKNLLKEEPSLGTMPEPPELTVHIGKQELSPTLGSYDWRVDQGDGTGTQVQADSMPPPELVKNNKPLKTSRDVNIELEFENQPESYKVKIWNVENEVINTSENINLSGKGEIIYEIFADWKQGTASYAFKLYIED